MVLPNKKSLSVSVGGDHTRWEITTALCKSIVSNLRRTYNYNNKISTFEHITALQCIIPDASCRSSPHRQMLPFEDPKHNNICNSIETFLTRRETVTERERIYLGNMVAGCGQGFHPGPSY